MQVQYINFFNQAKQYRSTNPVLSGIILLLILLLLPVVIVLAIGALALFLVYAKAKTFVRSLTRRDTQAQPKIKVTRQNKIKESEYVDYEIVEEK